MKNLFFVAVATGVFTGTSIKAGAQTNVNIERLAAQNTVKKPTLKFIESIEITPDKISSDAAVTKQERTVVTAPVSTPKTVVPKSAANIEQCTALQFKFALLMETEVELISNLPLYSFIDEWWATRYRYGGTDKNGIDCSSFTGKLVQKVYSILLPRTAREQYEFCSKVDREELKEGDLVFFNTRGGVSHVGFYLGNNYFAHSSVHSGVTISSLTEDYYNRKFISGGRLAIQE